MLIKASQTHQKLWRQASASDCGCSSFSTLESSRKSVRININDSDDIPETQIPKTSLPRFLVCQFLSLLDLLQVLVLATACQFVLGTQKCVIHSSQWIRRQSWEYWAMVDRMFPGWYPYCIWGIFLVSVAPTSMLLFLLRRTWRTQKKTRPTATQTQNQSRNAICTYCIASLND